MMNRRRMLFLLAAGGVTVSGGPAWQASLFAGLRDEDAAWKEVQSNLDASNYVKAEKTLSKILAANPKAASAYYHRGRVRFRLSRFADSVRDFDEFVALSPNSASRQWERGIACFYAGQFQAGAEQFKLYQTYHDNDVENSVWRFLCMVPLVGVEKARAEMLPIRNDRRIPMMSLYELFRGNETPWDVEAAIVSGGPDRAQLAFRRFYAQLYLGLYYESIGLKAIGRRFIFQAADDHAKTPGVNNWMWAVADVHAKRLRAAASKTPS